MLVRHNTEQFVAKMLQKFIGFLPNEAESS